ncbi:MAG TPA: hypothetical protein VGO98_02200 [Candidatus Saccharimonadales bacterium]|jgi:hypothetical protein|nr:hypothetical protein [Candidatus Saccharimonadales bacterium]
MIETLHLEPQKDFPLTDVSENNAAALEILLADPTLRETCHHTAERTASLYKLSHRVLRELVPTIPGFSTRDAEQFDLGVSQYEAAASLLRIEHADYLDNTDAAGYVMYLLHNQDQFNYFDRAHSRLLNDQENFSEVMTTIASLTNPSDRRAAENVLFGAAVQRQIEIDAIQHVEQKFRRDIFGDTGA